MRNLVVLALIASAGAAAAQAPAIPAMPMASFERLVSLEDYPVSARAASEQGDVEFTLTVGPNGRVTYCTVARSSGSAALDATTCRLMRARARFRPARDADGTPRFGAAAGRISWRIPGGPPVVWPFGASPAVEGATPKADLPALVHPQDYPASALRARESGRVEFRLDVGLTGRVEGCTITRSSGSSALDSTTCRLMRSRARFTPARDAQGNPALARYPGAVTWKLPGAPTP